jgi:hypothetical protein
MKIVFYVGCELYSAGLDAEGQDYVAEAFFVGAELEDGTRFRKGFFAGAEKGHNEDGPFYVDVREAAEAAAEALAASFGSDVDLSDWAESDFVDRLSSLECYDNS